MKKFIIFGPFFTAARRALRAIHAFLNPCPPPPNPFWELTPTRSFNDKLFLR